jgi:hypothetical protein
VSVSLPEATPQQEKLARIIDDAVSVADFFGVDLTFPPELTSEDLEALYELKAIMEGDAIARGGQLEATLLRDENNGDAVKKLQNPGTLGLERAGEKFAVFGRMIDIGPHMLTLEDFRVVDFEGTDKKFFEAPIGAAVLIKLEVDGDIRIRLRRERKSKANLAAG